MKKAIFVLLAALLIFVGCSNGKLKAGTFDGEYNLGDSHATAKVTIDNNGKITDVYFDEAHNGSTKKTLGDAYGMKSDWGSKIGEWYEQAEALEKAIVANQGVDFITLDETGKTDAVSGCTIKVNHLVDAFKQAIEKAK